MNLGTGPAEWSSTLQWDLLTLNQLSARRFVRLRREVFRVGHSTRALACKSTRVARISPVILPRMTASSAMIVPMTAASLPTINCAQLTFPHRCPSI